MDGIFGVGIAEVVLIGLVLFIVGGPENTLKWARELGRWTRKLREEFQKVWADLEGDLDDETKEFVKEMRTASSEVRHMRKSSSDFLKDTLRLVEGADDPASRPPTANAAPKQPPAAAAASSPDAKPGETQYPAWTPRKDQND